jgi:heme A synthase
MKKVFAGLASLLLIAEVAQFYLAASGAFDNAPMEDAFALHRVLGYSILLFAVVSTVVAALARVPGRLIGMAALIAGLVLVQSLIREVAKSFGEGSEAGHLVFGMHAINALAIVGVTAWVAQRSRRIAWQHRELSRTAS